MTYNIPINNNYYSRFYVRITCSDSLGIIRSVGEAAEASGVSIHAILQNPIINPKNVDFVVTTEKSLLSQIEAFTKDIATRSFAKNHPIYLPILD